MAHGGGVSSAADGDIEIGTFIAPRGPNPAQGSSRLAFGVTVSAMAAELEAADGERMAPRRKYMTMNRAMILSGRAAKPRRTRRRRTTAQAEGGKAQRRLRRRRTAFACSSLRHGVSLMRYGPSCGHCRRHKPPAAPACALHTPCTVATATLQCITRSVASSRHPSATARRCRCSPIDGVVAARHSSLQVARQPLTQRWRYWCALTLCHRSPGRLKLPALPRACQRPTHRCLRRRRS